MNRWGSLSFDNHFIPDQDARREIKIIKKMDLPTELILFPLTEEERKNYKVVPTWVPTKKDLGIFFWQILFMVDLVLIFAILLADYLYTAFIHSSYVSVIKFFETYNVTYHQCLYIDSLNTPQLVLTFRVVFSTSDWSRIQRVCKGSQRCF